jgi:hypothetical protein
MTKKPKPRATPKERTVIEHAIHVWSDVSTIWKTMAYSTPFVTAIVTGWIWAGFPLFASQTYVDKHVRPLHWAQNQTQMSVDTLLKNNLAREQLEYTKDPAAMTNPQVQMRLRQIQDDLKETDDRIKENREKLRPKID